MTPDEQAAGIANQDWDRLEREDIQDIIRWRQSDLSPRAADLYNDYQRLYGLGDARSIRTAGDVWTLFKDQLRADGLLC